ncbi:MAG: lytic transglycosylase domain-containing protein [Acidobacteria bacterium]|nr:lytic transglycosylase domain-containing protein [Acidobacteriota bacterium]MBV9474451.1 lytic transglycosylase domain-containing protein [Acidobacteriota bacterium]
MPEVKTKRPYQERFLDNFDRAQLRREVEAVRPRRFQGFRKKYATWALGASLAFGGLGVPTMIMQHNDAAKATTIQQNANAANAKPADSLDQELAGDLQAAQSIASQVAGGVAGGLQAATSSPLKAIAAAPQKLAVMSDSVREDFFKKEVPFGSIIYQEAKKNNLRPELVAAVVQAESKFRPAARSGSGAIGLMQLVPKTGRWMGARDLTNPAQNISAGAKYLRYLHDRFDGNETKVIAAYNAGEGNVLRFNGVPPFHETRDYVSKVKNFEEDFHSRISNRVADAGSASNATQDASATNAVPDGGAQAR